MRRRSSIASRLCRHRPQVALRDHARHVLLRRRLQPDGVAVGEQDVEGRRLGDDAARRRDHRLGVASRTPPRARGARSGGRRCCRRGRGSRGCCSRRCARSRGSARRTAARGRRRACGRASTCRRRAGRPARCAGRVPGRAAPVPNSSADAHAGAAQVGLARAAQQLAQHQPLGRAGRDVADQLGERAVAARRRPAAGRRIEALPTPYSRLARWRSETPAAVRDRLRVRPRRARSSRTRSPRASRKRVLGRPVAHCMHYSA